MLQASSQPRVRLAALWDAPGRRLFLGTFALGLLVHLPLLLSGAANPDTLWNSPLKLDDAWEIQNGRWALALLDTLRHHLVLPALSVVVSLALLGCVAAVLGHLFGLRGSAASFLLCLGLVSFPAVADTLTYYYCSDSYFLAFLLCALVVWLLARWQARPAVRVGLSILLFSLVPALYQPYVSVFALLGIFALLALLLAGEPLVQFGHLAAGLALTLVGGGGLYAGVCLLSCQLAGVQSVLGARSAGAVPLWWLPLAACRALWQFFAESRVLNFAWWGMRWPYLLLFCALAALAVGRAMAARSAAGWWQRLLLALLLVAAIPLALEAPSLLTDGDTTVLLRMMAVGLLPLLALPLLPKPRWQRAVVGALVLVLCTQYTLLTQASYKMMELNLNYNKSLAQRVVTRVEEQPGYDPSLPVVFLGNREEVVLPAMYPELTEATQGTVCRYGQFWEDANGRQNTWQHFLLLYLSVNWRFASEAETLQVEQSPAAQAMPVFPEAGSVQTLDGYTVVRLA